MVVTALEFYSGIGGMRCALQQVAPAAVVLDAFDINHEANRCYQHNFRKSPRQVDIEHMKGQELDEYGAELWLIAPPCQPFTRQGKQLGAKDNRSRSFLNILYQIRAMQQPPSYLLLENVVGFETSDMHKLLLQCLAAADYRVAEFTLTPRQYGIPYSRPRYFCLASKRAFPVTLPAGVQPCQCTPSLLLQLQQQQADEQTLSAAAKQPLGSHIGYLQTIKEYLQTAQQLRQPGSSAAGTAPDVQKCCLQQQQQQQLHALANATDSDGQVEQTMQPSDAVRKDSCSSSCHCRGSVQAGILDPFAAMWVPDTVIYKHAEVIDVVASDSRSCNCFTKAYGRLARGAGSMLATVEPAAVDPRWKLVDGTNSLFYDGYQTRPLEQSCTSNEGPVVTAHTAPMVATELLDERPGAATAEENQHAVEDAVVRSTAQAPPAKATDKKSLAHAWQQLKLRYFTPQEIAQLHSFPATFSFPSDLTSRQCYRLLGNSLSVVVVADLLHFLLLGRC